MANCDVPIFDCDRVLVNSEQIAQEIERELLAAAGTRFGAPVPRSRVFEAVRRR